MSALDPFYLVKEEIEDNVRKVRTGYGQWEQLPATLNDRGNATKNLLRSLSNIEWQLGELNRAIAVAERDPKRFSVDSLEIGRRKKWTTTTRYQIQALQRTLEAFDKQTSVFERQELLADVKPRTIAPLPPPPSGPKQTLGAVKTATQKSSDNFIQSESEQQAFLLKEQNEDLDDLQASVERLGDVGMTIHDELAGQERLLNDVDRDIDSTTTRLDFVQKKMELMIIKAGSNGQIFMIVFLVVLLAVLIMLIFYT